MDTVWIKLSSITEEGPVCRMFGGNGVVSMIQRKDMTLLCGADGAVIDRVSESLDTIFDLIGKVRNGVKVGEETEK